MTAIESNIGQVFSIELSECAPCGFVWEIVSLPPNVRLVEENTVAPAAAIPGASGMRVFTFKGIKKGTGIIEFAYRRPWIPLDKTSTPTYDVRSVVIH